MSLKSEQIERHVIAGLIVNYKIFADIENFVSEKDFTHTAHSVIYSCLKSFFAKNQKFDTVLIAEHIHNLGITFKDSLSISDYLESITFTKITPEATKQACQELVKLRVLRDLDKTFDSAKNYITKSINQDVQSTISHLDTIYNENINKFNQEEKVVSLFDGLLDLAEEMGNNPKEEIGLATPYPEFNRLYGGLRNKNLYIVAARAKSGKSSFLMDMVSEMSKIHKIPVLFLDTEMATREVQFRTISAKSGVGLWFVETGNWRKNQDLIVKVRTSLKDIKENYKVDHYSVGNKKIEDIASIARRWYLQKVGRGNQCIICFDYIKMADKLSHNQQEYQLMGDKVDMLKKLSEELDCPIVSAVQTNRSGITMNREVSELVDDESSIGISDRITWYASWVGILRRKVSEEILMDTPEMGGHKIITCVARFQGRDAVGHQDQILRTFPDGKKRYINNYINFNIENFKVEERGSLIHSIQRQNASFKLTSDTNLTDQTL